MLKKELNDIPAFTAGDDTLIREVLHPKNDGLPLNYSLAYATLEPGQASLPHILHKSSEVYIIRKGRGRAFIGGESAKLEPGQLAFIPAGVEQYIENIGEGPLEFWCIVSPPWSGEDEVVLK